MRSLADKSELGMSHFNFKSLAFMEWRSVLLLFNAVFVGSCSKLLPYWQRYLLYNPNRTVSNQTPGFNR